MKKHQLLITTLLTTLVPLSSLATEPPNSAQTPDQASLTQLIKGNTLNGQWAGRAFTQYFAPSGATQYKEGSGPTSYGSWWVNSSGQYCSTWPPSPAESCYDVLVDDKDIYWQVGDDFYPSTISIGNQF